MRFSLSACARVLALVSLTPSFILVNGRGVGAPVPAIGQNDAPFLDLTRDPVLLPTCSGLGPPVGGVLSGSPVALLVDKSNPVDGLDNVNDPDASENEPAAWHQLGIALIGVGTGGTWYYTVNNCATWSVVPAVSVSSALLLSADAGTRLYFQSTTTIGDVTIQFRAWDGSTGTNGSIANTTTNGGTTAFSINTDLATCSVFGVRQTLTSGLASSNVVSVPTLTSAQVGDVKVLIVATSAGQPVTTSQFNVLLDQVQNGPTSSRLWVGWRVVTSPEPVFSVTLGATTAYAACVTAIAGVNTSSPAQAQASQGTPTDWSHTAPAVLPSILPALITTFHEFANSVTWTPPAGMSELADRASSGVVATGVSLEVNQILRTISGAAGPYTAQAANTFAAEPGAAAAVAWQWRNSAPMLDNSRSPVMNSVAANAPPPVGPVGTLVSTLIDPANTAGGLDNLHDFNMGGSYGIAVTAAYVANGSWYYSINNGTNWNPLGIPSNSVARLLAADAGTRLYFQPAPGFSTDIPAAITFRAWDMTSGSNGATADPSVNGGSTAFSTQKDVASMNFIANVAPVNTVPAAQVTEEDLPIMFSSIDGTAFTVSDPDAGPGEMQVSLSVPNGSGALYLLNPTGITITGGADGSPAMTFTGTIPYINASLDGLMYVPAPDYNGTTSLGIVTNDLGHTGGGGAQSDADAVLIVVSAINDPPVNLVPSPQTITMNTPLVLSAGNGNGLSIVDVDAAGADVEVTLAASNGTLTLGTVADLDLTTGDGTADQVIVFTAPIGAANNAIATLIFQPAVDFGGAAGFTITTNDQGNSGSGGAWSSEGAVEIMVTTPYLTVSPRLILDGAYNASTGLMSDVLRATGLLPTTEPYSALGYAHVGGGGGETTTTGVLAVTGGNAIVDWVIIELRQIWDPSIVVASRSALLQRDGDVVGVDGTSAVQFPFSAAAYYVAVRHRNHLGVMTEASVALAFQPVLVDFSSSSTMTYGSEARKSVTGAFPVQALWAGDVNYNKELKYTGVGNDRDPILISVGSTTPNNTISNVYSPYDVNMNGQVKYTGTANDRDPILVNVGSTTPNNARVEQLP